MGAGASPGGARGYNPACARAWVLACCLTAESRISPDGRLDSWLRRRVFGLRGRGALVCVCALGAAGCFTQRSVPMRPDDPNPKLAAAAAATGPSTTRQWLEQVHGDLADYLPWSVHGPVITAELVEPDGSPLNVFSHFACNPKLLSAVWYNFAGLLYSAQSTGVRFEQRPPEPWPGFEDIWIPVGGGLELAGRLGLAAYNGRPIFSDCIILLPGLFGDNTTKRSRDLAIALRDSGLHVLSLEQRGHGRTRERFPDVPYTYGVFESGDLLAVAEWLQDRPEIGDTGVIGFCWGANTALLAAWQEGRSEADPHVPPKLASCLRPRSRQRLLRAGVLAFSPALTFEQLIDQLDRAWTLLENPVLESLGRIVAGRARQEAYALKRPSSLRELIQAEADACDVGYADFLADGLAYLRLLGKPGEPPDSKLEAARVPVLIVQSVDDPVASAQGVADLFAGLRNPNVAGVILPGGGHCGFAHYARRYYYNLVLSFFDRRNGAAACLERRYAAEPAREFLSSSN